jgi:hypothetical protein
MCSSVIPLERSLAGQPENSVVIRCEPLPLPAKGPRQLRRDLCAGVKITEDVRKFAAEQGVSDLEVLMKGMEEKSSEFAKQGADVYAKA